MQLNLPSRYVSDYPESVGGIQVQAPSSQGSQDDQDELDRDGILALLGDDRLELELVGEQDEETDAGDADGHIIGLVDPFENLDVALAVKLLNTGQLLVIKIILQNQNNQQKT